jgi:uncharacterized protein (TIGR02246 family)
MLFERGSRRKEPAMLTTLDDMVAWLAARVTALEDELAITRLLTSYGFAVDGDDAEGCADIYTDDAVVTIDGATRLAGRAEVRTIVTCDAHQGILPGCAHVMGPFAVQVDGDRAVATGYATVFVAADGDRQIWRQSYSRWELTRTMAGWRVATRDTWAVGRPEGQQIVREALHQQLALSVDGPT